MEEPSRKRRRFRSVSLFWLIPNMLTVAGFVSGLTALKFALDGRWAGVIVLIALAAVFDALDGAQRAGLKLHRLLARRWTACLIWLFLVWFRPCASISGLFRIQGVWRGGRLCSMRFRSPCVSQGSTLNCQIRLNMQRIISLEYQRQPRGFWC